MTTKAASALNELAPKFQIYVKSRLDGMTQIASAQAAGSLHPRQHGTIWEKRPDVQRAMLEVAEGIAEEIGFSRKEAHDMLIDAYRNAETATEQVAAVRELINLHGLAKPKVVEHKHDHQHTAVLEHMPNDELLKLADMTDIVLDAEYEVLGDGDGPEVIENEEATDGPGYQA